MNVIRNTFRLKAHLLWLSLAILLLLAESAAFYSIWASFLENARLSSHTHEALEKLQSLLADVTDAETGQRGYLLTGLDQFLEPYNTGRQAVGLHLNEAAKLTSDSAGQRSRMEDLRPLIYEKFAFLTRTIEMKRSGDEVGVNKIVLSGQGKQVMDRIRTLVQAMKAEELSLLLHRNEKGLAGAGNLVLWFSIGAGLLLIVLLAGTHAIDRDIKARARTAEDLRRQSALLDLAQDGIIVRREDHKIAFWSQGAHETYGWTRQEAMGQVIHELLKTRFPKPLVEISAEASANGRWQGELAQTRKDGVEITVASLWAVERDVSGFQVGILEINRDITEHKRIQESLWQIQKRESIGVLAGGIAHDFNNILAGVIGYTSLAREGLPHDSETAQWLQIVLDSSEKMAHLTRQMLAYSGRGQFLIEPLNLSALIPEMIGIVQASIPKKIVLQLELAPDLPIVEADCGQMQQVVTNLILNAAEAIDKNSGLISVKTMLVDEAWLRGHKEAAELHPGSYVLLEVRDTGCGMDEATKARIFDPFFTTKFTGRGLGLAAVNGIVRGHKGAIWVTSEPGKGSCFTALFPASERLAEGPQLVAPAATLEGTGTILVVDDEEAIRTMAKKVLERYGYKVLLAESALAAIDVFKRQPGEISLVILDLIMPGMGGEEALPQLRKVRPGVAVVVSSGYTETAAMQLFTGQPVLGFLQKPFTSSRLAEKVRKALAADALKRSNPSPPDVAPSHRTGS